MILEGVDSIEKTADLVGNDFVIPSDQLIQPAEGSYYPFQIIGLDVYSEENEYIGKLTEIYVNPNQSLYEIKKGKKEVLVPATREFIRKIWGK